MKKITVTLTILMCAFLGGLIATFHLDLTAAPIVLKALASLCFWTVGILNYKKLTDNKIFGKLMVAAFSCSLCGDVLLALDKNNGIMFIIGVASFAAAHVLFSVAFFRLSGFAKSDIWVTLAIFAVTQCILIFGGEFDYQGLFAVLVIYSAIISLMVAKAFSLRRSSIITKKTAIFIAVGAVFFLLSDIVLLYWLFGINMPEAVQSVNWVLYYTAQGCLSLSLGKIQEKQTP